MANGASTETALYNALGQRIQISGGVNGTVLYAYDEAGHLLGEYDGTSALIEETVWLGDIPVGTLRPNGAAVAVYYVHSDQLNTPRQVTRPSDNAAMWTWNSDPFCTDAANPNPSGAGTFAYNLRFPSQLFDGQAGLHQNYFRDFDPAVGRYAKGDPIGIYGGTNVYNYAGQNPIATADPLGLDPQNLGQGYTARVDPFNYGAASFEIHVFDKNGNEVGVYGPKGWIPKHSHSGRPEGVPIEVENSCKGFAVNRLRASGDLPPKGRMNIKGPRWMSYLKWLPLLDWYQEETRPSVERSCELDPGFDGC